MPSERPPTARQQQALDFICAGIRAGRAPTFRELCAHMGIRSTNGVMDHLKALVRKGYLEREPGRAGHCWCPYRPTAKAGAPVSTVEHLRQWVAEQHLACAPDSAMAEAWGLVAERLDERAA